MELHDIVLRPIITEKSTLTQQHENTYVFEVGYSANKLQIKSAIETLFDVSVLDVRTVRMRGKTRRFGRHMGKKAYVKLVQGDSLDFHSEN